MPVASTQAGPGLQPSNLHMMAQQAAAPVLAHFALPSAAASSTAFARSFPLQLPQPTPSGSLLHSSQVSLIGSVPAPLSLSCWDSLPAPVPPLQPNCHGFTSPPFSPLAYTWTGSSSSCASTQSDLRGPSYQDPSSSTPAHLPFHPSDGSVQRLNPHHTGQVFYRSDPMSCCMS